MPTASANTGATAGDALMYVLQEKKKNVPEEKKAVVFEYNQVYGTGREMGFQMKDVSDDRAAVKKPVLHVQISFHPDEKPTPEQAKATIDSILKDIGIEPDNHQYVVVQHRDKPHDHYHVVANRVGLDGSLVNDHRIIDRLQVACSKVEQEFDLRPTPNRTVIYDEQAEQGFRYVKAQPSADPKEFKDKSPKIKEVKVHVQAALVEVLKTATTPAELVQGLKMKNIEVKFSENKEGATFGISFRSEDIAVKGTAVGCKWKQIEAILSTNAAISTPTQVISPKESSAAPDRTKENELAAFILANASKIDNPTQLADETIRAVFAAKDGEERVNSWTAFRKYAEKSLPEEKGHDEAYDMVYDKIHKQAVTEIARQTPVKVPVPMKEVERKAPKPVQAVDIPAPAKRFAMLPDQGTTPYVAPAPAPLVIRQEIQKGIETYISNHAYHIKDADVLVSRAIIATYQRLEPSVADPLKAFESMPDQQNVYDKLVDYAEDEIEDQAPDQGKSRGFRR